MTQARRSFPNLIGWTQIALRMLAISFCQLTSITKETGTSECQGLGFALCGGFNLENVT